jgi:hypothetical protein
MVETVMETAMIREMMIIIPDAEEEKEAAARTTATTAADAAVDGGTQSPPMTMETIREAAFRPRSGESFTLPTPTRGSSRKSFGSLRCWHKPCRARTNNSSGLPQRNGKP